MVLIRAVYHLRDKYTNVPIGTINTDFSFVILIVNNLQHCKMYQLSDGQENVLLESYGPLMSSVRVILQYESYESILC